MAIDIIFIQIQIHIHKMKHLNIFTSIEGYENDKSGELLIRPNVSLVDEDNSVRYLDTEESPNAKYEYIDLGLSSGLKWAKCNIGATSETDYGLYFQWSATEGYTAEQIEKGEKVFDWSTTPYQTNPSEDTPKFTKYLGSTSSEFKDPSATDEDAMKTVLDPIDDAAVQCLGNGKRMPTASDYQNLKDGTLWVWSPGGKVGVKKTSESGTETIDYVDYPAGFFVYKVKDEADKGKAVYEGGEIPTNYSPNAHYEGEGESQVIVDGDTHIFFPASGLASGTGVYGRGSDGLYWSSSLSTSLSGNGHYLYFSSGYIYPQGSSRRYYGFCVRSVSET